LAKINGEVIEKHVEPKPGWIELVIYLLVGFGFYFIATFSLLIFIGDDLDEINLGVTVAIGVLNAACLVGTVYFTGIRRKKITWAGMGFAPPSMKVEWLLVAMIVSLILIPIRAVAGVVVEYVINGNLDSLQLRGDLLFAGAEPTIGSFLISMLIIGVLVPISEELYFRGLLYNWFQLRFRFWPAVFLSSSLFALAHYDSLSVIISSLVLGIANAIAMTRTKSIWVPIVMHAVTNGTAVIIMYIFIALEPYLELLA
jgi:membrane protease YdiL (CAAX protease family)